MNFGKKELHENPLYEKAGIDLETFLAMSRRAKAASEASYSPYSRFAVGASILTGNNQIFSGCNVENAAYGLANCAERTAIFSAVAQGEKQLKAVVIYTPTDQPASPCGACRQVINEFGVDCVVVSCCDSDAVLVMKADDYLPHGFGPGNLVENIWKNRSVDSVHASSNN